MDDRDSLERRLNRARRALQILEEEKAGYGLRPPVDLQIELEEKQCEVTELEASLNQRQGHAPVAVPDNLPRYNDVSVGRHEQIRECLEALSLDDRGWGVTIDGIGGIGKTALALEVAKRAKAQDLFDAYLFASAKTTWLSPEGVRAETLALSSLDAFCREFARLLGATDVAEMPDAAERRQALLEVLRRCQALLIWDNLETLTQDERHLIAEFLRKLPGANKAIITSQHRTGESARTLRLDRLAEPEAFALMQERGKLHHRIQQQLVAAGEAGYRALYEAAGGNPLALEWALGLVAQQEYSLQGAVERLRDADRSADLYGFLFVEALQGLGSNERTLLSALSVFPTPTTPTVLREVTGLASTEVEVALTRLVTVSLVNDLEEERYVLHPLTRTYVRSTLVEGSSGPASAVSKPRLDPAAEHKALRYWAEYARQYGGQDKDAYKTFDTLEAEWPTLEAVSNRLWALSGLPGSLQDREAAQMVSNLETALWDFLWFRGSWDEQLRLGGWGYQAGQALDQWADAGWGAYDVAWIHYSRQETEQAVAWADRTAECMERAGNRLGIANAIRMRGLIAGQRQDWSEAERLFLEVLVVFRELQRKIDESLILNDLGNVVKQQKQYNQAESYYKQALLLAEELNDKEHQAIYYGNLGALALDRDHQTEARSPYERQLTLAQEVGRQDLIANAETGFARVLEQEGRDVEALERAQAALVIQERLRHRSLEDTRGLVERLRQKVQKGS